MVVFMDLVSGYLVVEEVADDRTYETWYTLVEARLEALGGRVLYLVSDRAKALVKLAETGLDCLSIPDLFHLIHDLVKSYALALGRRLQQAHRHLERVSLLVHPWRLVNSTRQSSQDVEQQLQAEINALET